MVLAVIEPVSSGLAELVAIALLVAAAVCEEFFTKSSFSSELLLASGFFLESTLLNVKVAAVWPTDLANPFAAEKEPAEDASSTFPAVDGKIKANRAKQSKITDALNCLCRFFVEKWLLNTSCSISF